MQRMVLKWGVLPAGFKGQEAGAVALGLLGPHFAYLLRVIPGDAEVIFFSGP